MHWPHVCQQNTIPTDDISRTTLRYCGEPQQLTGYDHSEWAMQGPRLIQTTRLPRHGYPCRSRIRTSTGSHWTHSVQLLCAKWSCSRHDYPCRSRIWTSTGSHWTHSVQLLCAKWACSRNRTLHLHCQRLCSQWLQLSPVQTHSTKADSHSSGIQCSLLT